MRTGNIWTEIPKNQQFELVLLQSASSCLCSFFNVQGFNVQGFSASKNFYPNLYHIKETKTLKKRKTAGFPVCSVAVVVGDL